MAAPCRKFARSVLLKGFNLVPGRCLWTCRMESTKVCLGLVTPRCVPWYNRPMHPYGHMLSITTTTTTTTKTGTQESTHTHKTTEKKETVEEDEDEGPEYIPKRKAKNPMMKIGYAWMIGLPAGVIGFILAKREVDKNRLKQLRVRQRMKRSNEGEYEGSRYRNTDIAKLD
ncbi:DUF4748 domain-containing protein [Osmerus eperlanus]|uniref:DUF4748 domain-containing protein n=1 Tax=Osmerus eperlanus TaxID=29151 RepID=UPI002E15980E